MSDIWLQYEHHRPDCEFNTEVCEVCSCMEQNMADTIATLTARVAELEGALREKVARAIEENDIIAATTDDYAQIAIDIVLEEAARVADAMPLSHNAAETALEIAAAIRGMKGE